MATKKQVFRTIALSLILLMTASVAVQLIPQQANAATTTTFGYTTVGQYTDSTFAATKSQANTEHHKPEP
jgi:hypothetical protein